MIDPYLCADFHEYMEAQRQEDIQNGKLEDMHDLWAEIEGTSLPEQQQKTRRESIQERSPGSSRDDKENDKQMEQHRQTTKTKTGVRL
jgi:hypothetical protein